MNEEQNATFEKKTSLGLLKINSFCLETHVETVHHWVNQPYARYWQMGHLGFDEVKEVYQNLLKKEEYFVFMGYFEEKPMFLVEVYNPARELQDFYLPKTKDAGMHILIGPPEQKISGFSWQIFVFVMEFLFNELKFKRIIVEPDVRNEKIHILNKKAGFVYQNKIQLPNKEAYLAICSYQDFLEATQRIS